jgi:serpin B
MDGRPRWLFLSDVLHQTFIEVSEKGTEAAAVSATVVTRSAPAVFYADHPFLFFIRETATGSILFMGRVANPQSDAAPLGWAS